MIGIPPVSAENLELSSQSQKEFNELVRDLGTGLSYQPTAPSESLGITGFNLGVDATLIDVPTDENQFDSAFEGRDPSNLLIPKIHFSKGLPLNLDVSAFVGGNPGGNARLFGGGIKYSYIPGGVFWPAIGIRAHGTQLDGVDDLDLSTYGADVSISKGVGIVTPFLGYSQFQITGKENAGLGLDEAETSEGKVFLGLRLTAGFTNYVIEADIGEINTYSLRINFGL